MPCVSGPNECPSSQQKSSWALNIQSGKDATTLGKNPFPNSSRSSTTQGGDHPPHPLPGTRMIVVEKRPRAARIPASALALQVLHGGGSTNSSAQVSVQVCASVSSKVNHPIVNWLVSEVQVPHPMPWQVPYVIQAAG